MLLPEEMLGGEARPDIEAVAVSGEDGAIQETYPYLVELIAVVATEAQQTLKPLDVGLLHVSHIGVTLWIERLRLSG